MPQRQKIINEVVNISKTNVNGQQIGRNRRSRPKNHAIDIDMVKMHPDSWRGPIDIAKKINCRSFVVGGTSGAKLQGHP